MKRILIAVLSLALGACGSGSVESKAKEAVAAQLKDPASVQFRALTTGKTDRGFAIVCGEFNAKSGFGGYTGFRPFVWRDGSFGALLGDAGADAYFANDFIAAACGGKLSEYEASLAADGRYSQIARNTMRQALKRFAAK